MELSKLKDRIQILTNTLRNTSASVGDILTRLEWLLSGANDEYKITPENEETREAIEILEYMKNRVRRASEKLFSGYTQEIDKLAEKIETFVPGYVPQKCCDECDMTKFCSKCKCHLKSFEQALKNNPPIINS